MGSLRDKVNAFVEEKLRNYKVNVRGNKVIHDTILGTNLFYAHEIAVLDSPILQRLRRISQVDVVSLIWPSGNHNRFEHSLGVAIIGDKFIRSLAEKGLVKNFSEELYCIRMAGILHDCGHGPFSHMSEMLFQHCDDLKEEKKSDPKLAATNPNAHEILSYLIVTSEAFKEFYNKNIATQVWGRKMDLDFIGELIIGYISDSQKGFLVDIINGAFDADKLDYIQRDSHFTGVQMILDLDRLFYTLDVITVYNEIRSREEKRLTIDVSGVSTLEQIVFDKMMLQSTVYHHQKVRAAEGLFSSIFEEIFEHKLTVYGKQFNSAADYLYLTDDDIYNLAKQSDIPQSCSILAHNLLNRNLPKRALAISGRTVTKETVNNLWKLMRLYENPKEMKSIREKIADEAKKTEARITYKDIWLDMPKIAKFKEGDQWAIKSEGHDKGYLTLHDLFPVDQWVKAFSQNKWMGHVYTYQQYREVVHKASKKVIEDEYDIKFNDFSYICCKIQ
ncbi:HD domain-containing protein [Desulfallas thermosapovorans]|uniref:HD superfamily phosphohydrolase n=1 Tax=Desulfallas thermosapovorans DSM 6562 TaxID=1121431 RepID=A0A5S4ZPT1_9FIRM|nr:HD domain-containing protein [Desulfallas thermosapovorans]TYO94789.1 HD superfamily phosphohydrolase [Desulfallas thermosapovorans DSM 6562]